MVRPTLGLPNSAPGKRNPSKRPPGEVTTQLQMPLVIVCSPPYRNGSACNHQRLLSLATEDCSIGLLEGDAAWERGLVTKATGWSP